MPDQTNTGLKGRKWAQSLRAPGLEAVDETPIANVRLAATIGNLFLLLYLIADLATRGERGVAMHLFLIAGTAVFLVMTWTPIFERVWQLWVFAICLFIMVMFTAISAVTHDPVSRLSAIIFCPFATASFVRWSPRWQFALSIASLIVFGAAQVFVPIDDHLNIYRWLSVLAAVALAQSTAIFIDQYRRKIRGQLEALERAAFFRERQIATMAHDIRNPVSALSGYVELLEEPGLGQTDRDQMIARIGTTAWTTNIVVGNALDLYRMEEDPRFQPQRFATDPNPVIADVTEDCATQARRIGVSLYADLAPLPRVSIEQQQLARAVRNLIALPITAGCSGDITIKTAVQGDRAIVEIMAPGAKITAADLDQMMANPRISEHPPNAAKAGLFLARTMFEAAGGSLSVRTSSPTGITMHAELPCIGKS